MDKIKLLIATNNQDKLKEFIEILAKYAVDKFEVVTSKDFEIAPPEVEETGTTLRENAELKARAFYETYHILSLADDTGLSVAALNGAPGVYSARYAGENASYADNRDLMLNNMLDKSDRSAKFTTAICLFDGKAPKFFEGVCSGSITSEEKGAGGFGYDAIFKPDESDKTFGEMDESEKNTISHRFRAISKVAEYLRAG